MNKGNNCLFITLAFLLSIMPSLSVAFEFKPNTATATLSASSIPNALGNVTSGASGEASVKAYGQPINSFKDIAKIESITLGPVFVSHGFTLEVKRGAYGVWVSPDSLVGVCVYYNNCDTTQTGSQNDVVMGPFSVRLKRNSTVPYPAIPSGTVVATIKLRQYSAFAVEPATNGSLATLTFALDGELGSLMPTCDIKDFDHNVILPSVKRSDLVSHGTGRYTGATKEFVMQLECKNSPKVSIKFESDKMSGVASEDVLANKLSGNDNVGVQILFNSNPLKIGEKVAVLSSAGGNEELKFNAYYYYKGGTVQSGPVKSLSEFTFTYE